MSRSGMVAGLDLAVANLTSGDISLLFSERGKAFGGKLEVDVGDSPHGIRIVDLNDDGAADVVVANGGSNTLSVLLSVP